MKVLQICAAYKPAFVYGGPTMSVSMLSENLARAGVITEVYTTTANGPGELPVAAGERVDVDGVMVTYFKRITKDHSHFSPSLIRGLANHVKGFDIVHIHAWWNLVSVFSCLVALIRGVPVVVSPRGTLSTYSFQNRNIGIKWLIHQLLGKRLLTSCRIHVTSESESVAVKRLFKPKSMVILPNFVRLPEVKISPPKPPSHILKLLFFSRIEQKKGLELLLEALRAVTVQYTLTIAGNGDSKYIAGLKALALKYQIESNIEWAGFQEHDKFAMMEQHHLLVLPSYDENFGNVIIESLSVGTAVLISDQVGLADYVKANRLGWVCHADPSSIAWAINNISINQQDEIIRIRRVAPGIIQDDFNTDRLVKRYIGMYEKIITG